MTTPGEQQGISVTFLSFTAKEEKKLCANFALENPESPKGNEAAVLVTQKWHSQSQRHTLRLTVKSAFAITKSKMLPEKFIWKSKDCRISVLMLSIDMEAAGQVVLGPKQSEVHTAIAKEKAGKEVALN